MYFCCSKKRTKDFPHGKVALCVDKQHNGKCSGGACVFPLFQNSDGRRFSSVALPKDSRESSVSGEQTMEGIKIGGNFSL